MRTGDVLTQRSREAEGGTRSVASVASAATAVPPLRFKGFDGAWEEKKLGEAVSFSKGKGYSKSDIREAGAPLFLYGRMYTDYQTEVLSVDTFCEPQESSVFSKGNEVVCPASGETAEDIARASAVCKGGIILGGDLNILTPKDQEQLYSSFLALTLSNGSSCREIQSRAQGKTVVHVHNSDLEDIVFAVPRSSEQRKIGAAFREIDALIAAREEALGKLEQFKKAMLEKMFPRMDVSHGGTETRRCRVPELRFKGFEGEWEEQRLDEVAVLNPSCSLPNQFEYVDLESVVGTEMLAHRTELRESAPSRAQRLAMIGDLFYQTVRPYQKNNYLFELVTARPYVFSTGYAQLRPSCDSYFLMTIMQTDEFVTTVLENCTGTSYPAISDTNLALLNVFIPSLPEQRKIGAYFRSLDALLAARREEIGKLKDLKKALLERMFV